MNRDPIARRLGWIVLGLVGVLVYGTGGYMLMGWSFVDSLYMTVISLTTVGFTEVHPLDAGGRIFTISLIVLGGGLALLTISLVASLVVQGEFGARGRRRRMDRRIERMRDHYIVCAYGRVGRAVASELRAAGVPYVVIDPNEDLRDRLEEEGMPHMIEDPTREIVLRRAGVEHARALVCAVDSDATNVFITLTARSLNPTLPIVARASEPEAPERLERAGADHVVSPFVTSGGHMARMALDPDVVDALESGSSAGQALALEERLVEHGSPLAGGTVAEAPAPVLAVRRAHGDVIASPGADLTLAPGDVILLLRE